MDEKGSKACFLLDMCKKAVRSKKFQSQQSVDHSSHEAGREMPSENTARVLVEAYFRTFESVYRILHRPTFWQEYRRYWEGTSTNEAFAIKLKLCMALGSCFHHDMVPHRQSLAGKWIYDARVWLISPEDKARAGIETIQIMCLLHLTRETSGVGGDLSWVSAGSLLREAMNIGLHRDPDGMSKMTTLQAEMRRRLWATTMEIVLQSSIDSGGPPLVALTDFDTRPPSNYDDDQLTEADNPPPAPRPLSAFTQSTVQIALARSLPTRLGIAQYVNHFRTPSSSYPESLRWSTELSTACRALSATLQPHYDPAGVLPKRLTVFQLRLAEQMVHRFFLALTFPWLAQDNPAYFYARKLCVETALKLSRAATGGAGGAGDDFSRLATCAHGAFRSVPAFALLAICLELLWQVQEDQSFRESMEIDHAPPSEGGGGDAGSGAAPRQELVDAVRGSIAWSEQRIKAGDTNIKGRLFYAALLAQVNALERGGVEAEVEGQVMASVVEDLEHCWLLLKGPGTAGATSPLGEVAGEGALGERGEVSCQVLGGWVLSTDMPRNKTRDMGSSPSSTTMRWRCFFADETDRPWLGLQDHTTRLYSKAGLPSMRWECSPASTSTTSAPRSASPLPRGRPRRREGMARYWPIFILGRMSPSPLPPTPLSRAEIHLDNVATERRDRRVAIPLRCTP